MNIQIYKNEVIEKILYISWCGLSILVANLSIKF